jgi:hypothetical protein
MAERLLLDIQYECARNNVDLPWDRIAHRMSKSTFYTPSSFAAFCRECRTNTLLHAPYFAIFSFIWVCADKSNKDPGSSSSAIHHYLWRTRQQLIAEGQVVPPQVGLGGLRAANNGSDARGFVRDPEERYVI